MKHILKMRGIFLVVCFLAVSKYIFAQADSTKPEISVTIHHFVINNSFQYLMVETKTKVNNRWQPLKGQVLQLYLDSNKAEDLITKVQTDSEGKAKAIIPVALKPLWDATSIHKFIAVTEGTFKEEETTTETEITRAKISIDTSNVDGVRTVNVQVMKFENDSWLPAKDVEVKIGIRRLGGDLKIGDEETYTTDSLGQVTAEFKRDSMPGNEKGGLVLVAKVEDNDTYGSLSVDKTVPWGVYVKTESNFGKRSLWATRFKAPLWLVFMAYFIIVSVWGTIVYLVVQLIRIKRLGKEGVAIDEKQLDTFVGLRDW